MDPPHWKDVSVEFLCHVLFWSTSIPRYVIMSGIERSIRFYRFFLKGSVDVDDFFRI